ncbi:MAG: alpha-glucan family phosphorylase [Actinomycetes bacterium]
MKALRRFTVRAVLPEPLQPLAELVDNLRWSWHPETRDLFEEIDPEIWAAQGGDPTRLLGAVPGDRLEALARDRRFLRHLSDATDDLREYMAGARWYQEVGTPDNPAPACVAYFSPEFGITEVLPQYSGGLGILAGDHLKAASDLGVPIIGVGLLYRRGYFKQSLSQEGWQLERYPMIDPNGLPLTLMRHADGTPLCVTVGLPGDRQLAAQIWVAQVGRVPLLLLDSDVEQNAQPEREVTDRLYGGGTEHRLLQEMLLGIGGVRALRVYCAATGAPDPEVFHTNEGHAGFLGLERIRELTDDGRGLSFDEAMVTARAGTVFTTHTPVPAGIDRFPRDLIASYFGGDNACPGVPVERVLALGAETFEDGDPHVFNMAVMGLRLAQWANGVSKLHGAVSREMFRGLWPGFDVEDVPITSITNGVHAPTWVARDVFELAKREIGTELIETATGWEAVDKVPDAGIWATRRTLRARLVDEVRTRVKASWLQRGASEAELGWIAGVFDPDVCTIGFARRVPSYKRLTLMLRDPDRLKRILLDPDRPVQLVIAGKAHPADDGGKALVQQIVRFADNPEVRHRIVFLPDYDIGMAKPLYPGCDVWLNNPLRPLEACGTSGMKAALNGCLNLSIRDGWWDELYDGDNGWAIPTADGVTDPDRRDDLESAALYDLIENHVRMLFYERGRDGLPLRWIEMVRHTLRSLGPDVLASRMVSDYVRELYAPAAESSRRMLADGYAGARELSEWVDGVRASWHGVRVEHVESTGVDDVPELGQTLVLRALVRSDGLSVDDLEVQAAYGIVVGDDDIIDPTVVSMDRVGDAEDGLHRYETKLHLRRTGSYGYAVRVFPSHPLLASTAELGLIAVPEGSSVPLTLP